MSPGFQMLIRRGLMQIARTPRMGLQLIRLRAQEREIDRQVPGHTPKDDPGGAIVIVHTLAVQTNLANNQIVCGGPSVKSLLPCET